MRTIPTLAGLALALTLGACDTEHALPTATMPPDGPATLVTDGPSMPGHSHLIRIGVLEWTISTADPDAQLFTIYGDPTEIFDCGGPGGAEYSVQFNQFDLAMGRMRNLLAQGGEIFLHVYEFFTPDDLNGRTFCEYFAEEWKYRGMVRFTEIFHRNLVQNNTAWHWSATGAVYDADGNPYSYNESQTFRRAANGGAVDWLKETIKVTPRGQ